MNYYSNVTYFLYLNELFYWKRFDPGSTLGSTLNPRTHAFTGLMSGPALITLIITYK